MDEQPSDGSGKGWLTVAALGLLLLGTIAFVLGRLADELTFDYISISCSAVAGIALIAAVRSSRRVGRAGV
jgi:hypothetical protein